MVINRSLFNDETGNDLRLSSVLQIDQSVDFKNFSAKYVVSGKESYKINSRNIILKEGEYVIGNKNTTSKVFIDDKNPVKGICVDIAKDLILDVSAFQFENSSHFSNFLFDQEWMVQKYNATNSALGYALNQLSCEFDNLSQGHKQINKELFYGIAECIVNDQSKIYSNFKQLRSIKHETNGRLFNFVHDAKNYIDNNFLEKINLNDIAREAKLSEYHFIRLFNTVFKTTPYKYTINKRLDFAQELLKNHYNISDIAILLGYTDVPAFSKSFKQKFGVSPKNFKTN